jgi:hypothetical protein
VSLHLVADLQANKDRFVRRVLETQIVWGLRSIDGWANCPSNHNHDVDVLLFWSDEPYAKRLAVAEWSAYVPTPITLDSFIDDWLRGMHQDLTLAGVNFNADLAGLEIEPLDLANELVQKS